MSTLNSTNMSISRPTTKVRHAPGGSSSISLSFDETPVPAKGGFKAVYDDVVAPAPEPVAEKPVEEPVKAAEPEPAAVVPTVPKVVVAPVATTTNVTDKVALVVATSSPAGESLKARTLEVLQSRGISQVTVTSVLSLLQLPFATKQLLARGGGFTSVIVIAAITEEVWAAKEVASAVLNGIVQLSLEQSVPIVPGFVFAANDKEAIAKGTDAPEAWVTSAISLAKPDTAEIVSTGPVKVIAVPEVVAAPEPATTTLPDKTDKAADSSKAAARPQGAVDTTPVRGRHRGAGPSSIIFG